MRRVMRVSLRHSKRDLVAQEMGAMHQVSRSSSVSTFCWNEIKDRNHKTVQHPFLFQEKNVCPPPMLYVISLEIFHSPPKSL